MTDLISKITREQKRNATKCQLEVAKSTAICVQRGMDLESPKPSFAFVLFNYLFPFRGMSGGGGWRPYGTSHLGNKLLPQPQGCDGRVKTWTRAAVWGLFPNLCQQENEMVGPILRGAKGLQWCREGQVKNLPLQRHLYLHVVCMAG